MSLGIKLRVLFLHRKHFTSWVIVPVLFLSFNKIFVCACAGWGYLYGYPIWSWIGMIQFTHLMELWQFQMLFFLPSILTCPLCSEIPSGYTHLLHSKPRPLGSFFFIYFPSCFPDLLILIISFSSSVSLSPACSNLLLNHSGEFLNF